MYYIREEVMFLFPQEMKGYWFLQGCQRTSLMGETFCKIWLLILLHGKSSGTGQQMLEKFSEDLTIITILSGSPKGAVGFRQQESV